MWKEVMFKIRLLMSEENKIELEIERIINKFVEENKLSEIKVSFQEPENLNEEWKKFRGLYDRKTRTIFIKLEGENKTKALIFRTLAHELAHSLASKDTFHSSLFWNLMDEETLPFIRENLQLEEDRINLEKLENPITNEDEEEIEIYLEPKRKKGKIYSFIEEKKINQIWKTIREETLNNKLGTKARVTTDIRTKK